MRKLLATILLLLCGVLLLSNCNLADNVGDKLNGVPSGYTKAEEHFDPNGFQDYTDYAKYYYEDGESFTHRHRYKVIGESDVAEVKEYFSNFHSWMKKENRLCEFDFDPACITVGDYWFLEDKEGKRIGEGQYMKYEDYTLPLYDVETSTLYYIHHNL